MPKDLPLPPPDMRFMERTQDEYFRVGDELVTDFAALVSLESTDTILDIGSGYGRMAGALWRRGHRGRYVGMDILEPHISWCTEYMTPASDGLYTFHHLDIRNGRYNPNGALRATEVSLDLGVVPDVILLNSVFTHMHAEDIVHYLHEIGSMLSPHARVMATFFLINQSQQSAEGAGLSRFPLRFKVSEESRCWTLDDPLHIIAYYESWVQQQVNDANMTIQMTRLGSWCGRSNRDAFQDTLILVPA